MDNLDYVGIDESIVDFVMSGVESLDLDVTAAYPWYLSNWLFVIRPSKKWHN